MREQQQSRCSPSDIFWYLFRLLLHLYLPPFAQTTLNLKSSTGSLQSSLSSIPGVGVASRSDMSLSVLSSCMAGFIQHEISPRNRQHLTSLHTFNMTWWHLNRQAQRSGDCLFAGCYCHAMMMVATRHQIFEPVVTVSLPTGEA